MATPLLSQATEISRFIQRGAGTAISYTTTLCAVRIKQLTNLSFVSSETKDYNAAWLYSVALAGQVDPGQVVLGERAGEVAFALADVWLAAAGRPLLRGAAAGGPGGAAAGGDVGMASAETKAQATDTDESEAEDAEHGPLPWEVQEVSLPGDLAAVLHRFSGNVLQVDAKALLEGCPRWAGLKYRAEQNNHRQDGSRRADQVLRQLQQKLLGLQRLYPLIHQELDENAEDHEETKSISQQVFGLLLEAEKFCLVERKKMSIPGSIVPEGPQLFSQEDLKHQAEVLKINQAGTFSQPISFLERNQVLHSFPVPPGA